MLIDKMINGGASPVLEQVLKFTEARQSMIADNIANKDTPGYRAKDLSVEKFQTMLRNHVEQANNGSPGSVNFDDIKSELEHPNNGILFHDGNNVSMEQLMSDNAKNVLLHNMIVELLKKQYQTMEMSLKDHAG